MDLKENKDYKEGRAQEDQLESKVQLVKWVQQDRAVGLALRGPLVCLEKEVNLEHQGQMEDQDHLDPLVREVNQVNEVRQVLLEVQVLLDSQVCRVAEDLVDLQEN